MYFLFPPALVEVLFLEEPDEGSHVERSDFESSSQAGTGTGMYWSLRCH